VNLALKAKIFLVRNNPEKVVEYLNNPQYELDSWDKIELVVSLKNRELIEFCLKDDRADFTLPAKRELLISYGDKDLIKEAIKSQDFDFEQKAVLIKETKDVELVKEYLQNEGKGEGKGHNEFLIASTENYDFIEECLLNDELGLSNDQKIRIITITDNDSFIKRCLANEKLGFKNWQKVRLIRCIGKADLVEHYIYDESLGFTNAEKIEMISGVENNKFIRKCLNDERLAFDSLEKKDLLLLCDDLKLIKESILDEDLNFTVQQKIELIVATGNRSFMRRCLKENILRLNDNEKNVLLESTQDIFFLKECLDNGDIDKEKLTNIQKAQISMIDKNKKQLEEKFAPQNGKKLNLPNDMTIGMEIECEGISSEILLDIFDYGDWSARGDGSLENGIEIVSPILHPTEKDSEEIYTVTNILNSTGQYISDKCGGHVHIGAKYLTSVQSYMNLMELYCNNEKAIYAMCNEANEAPRNGIPKYASPISGKMQQAIENGTINLEDENSLGQFIKELKDMQGDRYSGINFMNINNNKNTVEFRLANGTINPKMWIENANLFGGMVAIAEELAQIQKNGVKSEEDKHKLEIFDKLKKDVGEKEKVEILLELVGVEPETYMQRYKANIGLIKDNQELEEVFTGKEPLDFKVAKEKFKGNESQEIEASARAQIEARDNIVEGHERNLQNERDDRSYTH